jgi:hypothetical protein
MAKMIISIGYKEYVMDTVKAMAVAEALGEAEFYESKYRNSEDGGTTHHVWEQDANEAASISLRLLPNNLYRLAKLAGKRED